MGTEVTREDVLKRLPVWAPASRVMLMGLRGSHAHGTYISPEEEYGTDDTDVFVVTAQPVDWYLGLKSMRKKHGKHFETGGDSIDVKMYDVKKFGHLLRKGNPNVHNWLWAPEDCYLHISEAGQDLIDSRECFLSGRILTAIHGYARGQIHRMKRPGKSGHLGAKRKKLFDRHGYSTKNASHALRIMWMGISLGFGGIIQVRWDHHMAGLLMRIKRGEFSLQKVLALFDHYMPVLDAATEAGRRDLPEDVDPDVCHEIIAQAIHTQASEEVQ